MVEVSPEGFIELYESFLSTLPAWAQDFVTLFFLAIIVVFYAWFIWKFYRFIATKNIIKLNLRKYNKVEHPFFTKLVEGSLSFVEYIIILPFLIFFWFAVFTLFLIFLTEGLEVKAILIISATIIAAIRLTSYIPRYGEDLAKEIAKLLPFTLLAISITKPGFFDITRILAQIGEIPIFFSQVITYLLFIIILETVLRLFEFVFSLIGLDDDPVAKVKTEEEEE